MNKTVMFATGNLEKMRDASYIAEEYGVKVEQVKVEIDEIQHHDPLKITEHKTRAAYEKLQVPVVVNDSHWSLTALGGFPGGYMKDVNEWFTTDDFINLMRDKKDKTVILTDVNGYYDGKTYRSFKAIRHGIFVGEAHGVNGPPFSHLTIMDGEGMTISEVYDQPNRTIDPNLLSHWHDFMQWYVARP